MTERTKQYLASVTTTELDRPLEPGPDPSTVAVRIVSIVTDCHLHAGEASYINGLIKARDKAARTAGRKSAAPRAKTKKGKTSRKKRGR